jgi:flagellar hook assembly protein FlgD
MLPSPPAVPRAPRPEGRDRDQRETGVHMTRSFTTRHQRLARALVAAVLALAALLVGVWAAPRASGAAAAWLRTPSVRLHALRPPGDDKLAVAGPEARGAGAPVTLDAGMRFTMAGVTCDVPAAVHGGGVSLRLRTSLDGAAWSRWLETPLEVAGEGSSASAFTDPLWTGAARYVQVAATGGARRGASVLSGVRLVAIDPTEDSSLAARVGGAIRRLAATVAGFGVTSSASAASSAPVIVTRAEWGADEKLRKAAPSYAPVKMAFVHHTASGNVYSQADAPALVRGIYAYHTESLGWNDIAYNFLIDRFGTIYEGRYGGVSRGVVGAHVYGFNTGSTGISLIGTFTDAAPPAEAVTALERLLAWKLAVHGLDPAGTATMTCGATDKYPAGAAVTFPVIAGHRQANYTECPGDTLYALLPTVRAEASRRVGSTVTATLGASEALISPGGDGVLDSTELDGSFTTPCDWGLVVKSASGRAVASWTGQGSTIAVTWDGRAGGSPVPDGVYTAELTGTLSGGDTVTASTQITVDTTAPRLTSATAAPTTFSPGAGGRNETAAVTYVPAEACAVRVGVQNAGGEIVRWLHGWQAKDSKTYTVPWDGRVTSGGGLAAAPDGQYRFDVERRDAAGNIARQGVRVTVDRTLGSPAAAPQTISPNGDGVRDISSLGFTLTRKAVVTVRVLVGGEVVRTLALGELAAGRRTVTWDGRAGSGEYLASSRPSFTVTAVSALGESSASGGMIVDLYRPRLYATAGKTVAAGAGARLGFKAIDPYSARVDVSYVVTDARGRRVASGHPGWQPVAESLRTTWKPAARGVFTVTWRAVDLGGNREAGTARTVVRSR